MFTSNDPFQSRHVSRGSIRFIPCTLYPIPFFHFTTRAYNCALNRIIAKPLWAWSARKFCSIFLFCLFVNICTNLFYIHFLLLIYTNIYFIFFYCLSIVTVIVIVCHWVWTLGVWGELACHKRLFNPPPQFSRLGTWCPTLLCATVLFVSVYVLGWRMGGGGWHLVFLSFLFSVASML